MTLKGGTRVWVHVWAKASAAFTMNVQWQLVSKRAQKKGELVSGRAQRIVWREGGALNVFVLWQCRASKTNGQKSRSGVEWQHVPGGNGCKMHGRQPVLLANSRLTDDGLLNLPACINPYIPADWIKRPPAPRNAVRPVGASHT